MALSNRLSKHFPHVKLPTCPPGALHRACRGKGAAVEKVYSDRLMDLSSDQGGNLYVDERCFDFKKKVVYLSLIKLLLRLVPFNFRSKCDTSVSYGSQLKLLNRCKTVKQTNLCFNVILAELLITLTGFCFLCPMPT